jgi:hypothetical protein
MANLRQPIYTPGVWVVAFIDNGPGFWWDVFSRPGFRHCLAFRYMAEIDAWALVDWGSEGFFIEFLPKRFITGLIAGVKQSGGCFLEIEAKKMPPRMLPSFPLYCVSVMKHLIGLKDWRVFTPYQLYCALLKNGASKMFTLDYLSGELIDGQNLGRAETAKSAGTGS